MARFVEEGKVRSLGFCAVSADELRAANALPPIAALQSEWSIFTRDNALFAAGRGVSKLMT